MGQRSQLEREYKALAILILAWLDHGCVSGTNIEEGAADEFRPKAFSPKSCCLWALMVSEPHRFSTLTDQLAVARVTLCHALPHPATSQVRLMMEPFGCWFHGTLLSTSKHILCHNQSW